jgi:hypothetical protein
VACPFGRLVFTPNPLLSTLILADPFGQDSGGHSLILWGDVHSPEGKKQLAKGHHAVANPRRGP